MRVVRDPELAAKDSEAARGGGLLLSFREPEKSHRLRRNETMVPQIVNTFFIINYFDIMNNAILLGIAGKLFLVELNLSLVANCVSMFI